MVLFLTILSQLGSSSLGQCGESLWSAGGLAETGWSKMASLSRAGCLVSGTLAEAPASALQALSSSSRLTESSSHSSLRVPKRERDGKPIGSPMLHIQPLKVIQFVTSNLFQVLSKSLILSCLIMSYWPGPQTFSLSPLHICPPTPQACQQQERPPCMILENVQFCETITAKEEHIIFFFLQKLLVLPSAEVLRKGVSSPDFGSDRSLFCLDGPSTYLRF